jgi:hypothetical protein
VALRGVDVSAWQHDDPDHPQIDWVSLREAGCSFVIIKATQAADYTNEWLEQDVAGAHAARLVIGLYHFAEPGACDPDNVAEDAKAQALFACSAAAGLPLSLGIACDLEVTGPWAPYQLGDWFKTFAGVVNAMRHHCPLYVNRDYLSQMPGAPFGHRLWLALGTIDMGQIPETVHPYMVQTIAEPTKGFAGEVDQDVLLNARAINPTPTKPAPKPKAVDTPPPPVVKSEEK